MSVPMYPVVSRHRSQIADLDKLLIFGEPGWDRTIDLLIKSQPLYH
jgi:hypothetical protein